MNTTEPTTPETAPTAEQWAIVELLGHVRLAGKLTEEERFGAKLGRLDIPYGDKFVTRLFGGGSVYSITYVSEEAARAVALKTPAPVQSWELPRPAITAPVITAAPNAYSQRGNDDDFDDHDDEDHGPILPL